MGMLEVRLMGSFEIKDGKTPVNIPSRPAQSLFAYLILSAGTSHRREKLAGLLWPDCVEETARDYLRHALWRIRKALPSASSTPHLLADDLCIAFNASSQYWLDAAVLDKVSAGAFTNELISALSAYRGELLPGFYDEWIVLEREHLNSVFELRTERLLGLLQQEGRWLDVFEWAERWISHGQKPEPAFRALMNAYAARGDMSKVAATYKRCVKSLEDFGVEPSEQTVKIYESLKAGVGAPAVNLLPGQKQAPSKTKASRSSNLPVPLTSFVGHEKEVAEILRLSSKNRLVTLTGSGGVGKTRLAIEAGGKLAPKFKDGAWWVDLVGLADSSLVPQAVAKVVDAREVPNQPTIETLVKHLESKELLLVLDNCEHQISACVQLVDRLSAACRTLKILTTSREALHIAGETTLRVPSLSLPGPGDSFALPPLNKFESIQLFVERAILVQPTFQLSDQNAKAVVQICRRLSGIPLAIELAAARVKMMSVHDIAKRLDDRFDLLTSGNRAVLPRHQTLRAAIDWSYDLLAEQERILFRRLAVFAGGFTLEAAEAVCAHGELERDEILNLLEQLVDKSLVIVESTSAGSDTRFSLLETIREYAFEKLVSAGEAIVIRDRHLGYFMQFAEETEQHLYAPEQVEWFARAETQIENMRTALDWSTTDVAAADDVRIRKGLRLAGALSWFWQLGYSREFSDRLNTILSQKLAGAPTIERAKALNAIGFLHWTLGNFDEARRYLVEALEIGRHHQDELTLGWTLGFLGFVLNVLGDQDEAQRLIDECVATTKGLGNMGNSLAGMALGFRGDIYLARGDESHAMESYEDGAKLLRATYNANMLAYAVRRIAYLVLKQADQARARTLFKESLILNREVGHRLGMLACMGGLAKLALAEGRARRAAQLLGVVEGHLIAVGLQLMMVDKAEFDSAMPALRESLDEKTLAKSWAKGKAMTLEDAMAFALEET